MYRITDHRRRRKTKNSGKSSGKFGQKQWKNLGKSNEKTRKAVWDMISGKNYGSFGQFHELTYYFQNLLLRSD